jgi:predicted lipoprotein
MPAPDRFVAWCKQEQASIEQELEFGKPLGATSDEAKPKLAAFWRSNLTFANAAGNLEGVRTLFAQGGFAHVVVQESPGVEDSITSDLDRAIGILRALNRPFSS